MNVLAKLNLKVIECTIEKDPVKARRAKLLSAVVEQTQVLEAAIKGQHYAVRKGRWRKDELGQKTLVETERRVLPWFFEQDNGWYVQCRYGSRILTFSGKNNAVFVNKLEDVKGVLEAFKSAVHVGEFDAAVLGALVKAKAN